MTRAGLGLALWLLAAALYAMATAAPAASTEPDYAREQRWAQEIAPAILVGDPLDLKLASGRTFLAIYTNASKARAAVIVVHGLGLHPDWGLINTLRSRLPNAGYATLSVQMPVLAADAKPEDYASTFAQAAERLHAAIAYLHSRGHRTIALVTHSMGARMSNYFLVNTAQPGVVAWAALGLSGGFSEPERLHLPVLDLYGEHDLPDVLAGAARRADVLRKLAGSAQVQVSGADHFFTDREDDMVQWVRRFLDRTLAR